MQLVLFCGIQATGKSTFYQQRFFHSHLRLSLDLLRTRHREQRLLQVCLETQMRCVIDSVAKATGQLKGPCTTAKHETFIQALLPNQQPRRGTAA
ncbi:MAG: hypothetical protein EOO36_06795 [Cytophagaceae bacterium]|nr:MAG: hypothetical protein EOO36_06795 [Cytophagaceae bacterium]